MTLPIKFKPENTNLQFDKFILIKEKFISFDICNYLKKYIDENPSTHRRQSKTPKLVNANFLTCLFMEYNYVVYDIIQNELLKYNFFHKFNLTFFEPLEIKKYHVCDEFSQHKDNYYARDDNLDRKLNVIIQLSDMHDYDGGDLILVDDFKIPKNIGTLVIFPSYYMHSVSPITSGTRYSLIGHAWGPEFK